MRKSTLPFFIRTLAPEGDGGGDSQMEDQDIDDTQDDPDGDNPGNSAEDSDTDEDEDDSDPEGADELGDPGKKALDRMKQKWRDERKRRQELEKKLTGEDSDKEDSPEDKAAAILKRANDKILRSEIKAAAAGKLADPADAYRFLNLEDFEVSEDGEVDEDDIAEAIDALIEKKPYLAAQTQGERRFKGGGGNGVRKETRPRQLTERDLERMSAEQIEKARKDGRLDTVLGIKR